MKLLFNTCLALLLLTTVEANAQAPLHLRIPRSGEVVLREIKEDFHPGLMRLEAPAPDGESEKAKLASLKEELSRRYPRKDISPEAQKSAGGPSPLVGNGFRSNNTINGVPNDNDMAISNDGLVVSVINSNIWIHDETGAILSSNISLDAWSASLGLNGDKFDPRALYDPVHDRFIIACLNGFTDSTSWTIVGFSQTNDPAAGWNLYALPGDPRGDSLWTDYPIMALTQEELFLTANLLYNDQPWQTGFQRSLCWQMDLDSAYAGATLPSVLWDSVYYGGRPVRNLCPVQGGSAPAGPGIHFLSNRNLTAGNDTVFFMEITDTIGSAGAQFNVNVLVSDKQYILPPSATQSFSQMLATNDARWLDAMIENDVVQFVGNTLDTTTGRSAVYHGIIRDASTVPTVEGHIVANPNGDFGYPGIAYMGLAANSIDALIGLNHVGPNNQFFPSCGAVFTDGYGYYSDLVSARSGTGYINAITGQDRWGDYMGVQRQYNQPGWVWIAGTWGQASHLPATWITPYTHPTIIANENPQPEATEAVAFPNPVEEVVQVEFSVPADEFIEISLYNMEGVLIRTFLRDRVRAGLNRFSFTPGPLAAGVYMLRIDGQDGTHVTRKVVKAN